MPTCVILILWNTSLVHSFWYFWLAILAFKCQLASSARRACAERDSKRRNKCACWVKTKITKIKAPIQISNLLLECIHVKLSYKHTNVNVKYSLITKKIYYRHDLKMIDYQKSSHPKIVQIRSRASVSK